ncbi:MAG: translation elongation factor-like protein [Candidatus Omnitrophica bacterium]|nr:translation elongation factor-like protein [Candidatus Omnitrophota bacterium]
MSEVEIGKVTHYYGHISVAIIELFGDLKVGDNIHIKGHTSDFNQQVSSMEVEHKVITEAKAGDSIGIKASEKTHPHDKVFKVTP